MADRNSLHTAGRHMVVLILCMVAGSGVFVDQAAEAQPSEAVVRTGEDLADIAGRSLTDTVAPAFVLQTIDDQTIDLSRLYGRKAVYLKFWATWCVPCRAQMPHFQHAYEMAGPDLAVIGINLGFNDSIDDVRKVIMEDDLTMPTVLDDGTLAAAFGLRVTPQHVVIGQDGRIRYIGHFANERLDGALRAAQFDSISPAAGDVPWNTALPAVVAQLGIGDALPALSIATIHGEVLYLRDRDDRRPTALVFLSPWCESYLAASRPAYAAACRDVREQVASVARNRTDVRWIGVASGLWATHDRLRAYEQRYSPAISLTLDESGDWFRLFAVMQVPTVVLADANGEIVHRIEGTKSTIDAEIGRFRLNRKLSNLD